MSLVQENQILNGVNMIHIEDEIFIKKKFDFEKLKEFGFSFENNIYVYTEDFLDANFKAIIEISDVLSGKVIDNLSDEEYMPLRIESYDGEYVCKVREAYKSILKRIADACCTDVFFACEQANRIANLIHEIYGVKPDFPWNDDNGVFRHLDTRKWFSLIMFVSIDSLLKNGNSAMVNVMNLKTEQQYDVDGIYPAFHMNHKYWISLILDDTLSDTLIMELVSKSYNLTKKKRRK